MKVSIPPRQETARESPFFARRLAVLGAIGVFIFLLLLGRLTQLCVIHGEDYFRQSEENIYKIEPIEAPRGILYDRFGRALATNKIAYSAYLTPYRHTTDTLNRSVARFEELTKVRPLSTHRDLRPPKGLNRPYPDPYKRVLLARGLPLETAALIAERPPDEMPGISVEESFERVYSTQACPDRYALSHVIGFIGAIDKDWEEARYEKAGIDVDRQRDRIGKRNLEFYYEDELRGKKGRQWQVYDSFMRPRGKPQVIQPAQSGADLALTLDADLQTTASRILEGFEGALIAMDPRDGAVLALVSKPEFGYPREPGRPHNEWNYAINGTFAPGSTFKIVTASAALLMGFNPEQTFVCDRRWPYGDRVFTCLWAHGSLNLYDALRSSCNIYFFELARYVKWGPIAEAAVAYGFGAPTGIDLADSPGTIGRPASPEQARKENGDIIQMAIGQGRHVLATPLQLLTAYAAVANKQGLLPRPHLVGRIVYSDEAGPSRVRLIDSNPRGPTPASNPHVRNTLVEGFRRVVESRYGTAHAAGFNPDWKVAGKTGSAQWSSGKPTHGWFVGFAPWDDPEICVVVLCLGAGHGGEVAAPLARKFLETYFDVTRPKRRRGLDIDAPPAAAIHGPPPESEPPAE